MDTQEIRNGNKIIAEFMGGVWKADDKGFSSYPSQLPSWAMVRYDFDKMWPGACDYHESFDWLMPVVEKIEAAHLIANKNINVRISQAYIHIEGADKRIFKSTSIEGSKIKALWLAVIEFIQWYNQNKQQ